jgi:hypothetical protein
MARTTLLKASLESLLRGIIPRWGKTKLTLVHPLRKNTEKHFLLLGN